MVTIKQSQVVARADGVTVICFHPGWVRSDMGGSGADLEPSEAVAGVARSSRLGHDRRHRLVLQLGWQHPPLVNAGSADVIDDRVDGDLAVVVA